MEYLWRVVKFVMHIEQSIILANLIHDLREKRERALVYLELQFLQ